MTPTFALARTASGRRTKPTASCGGIHVSWNSVTRSVQPPSGASAERGRQQRHRTRPTESQRLERSTPRNAGKGKQPSLHVQTASERARGEPKFEAGDVGVVEIAGGAGDSDRRFGSLVHAVLATVPLDSDAEQIRASTQWTPHFRCTGKEIEAAVTTVASALQHPLMERARKAAACGACSLLKSPLTLREEGWTLIEGWLIWHSRKTASGSWWTSRPIKNWPRHWNADRRQVAIDAAATLQGYF